MPKKILTLFVFIALFYSCKKESEVKNLKFPFAIKPRTIESVGKIRVFTKDGEILDNDVISNFTSIHFSPFRADTNYYKINFLSADSAQVNLFNDIYHVASSGSTLLFGGRIQLFRNTAFSQSALDRAFLIYKSNIFTGPIETYPQSGIIPVIYKANLGFTAVGNRESCLIKGYSYRLRLYSRGASHTGSFYGEFQTSFLSELLDRDTLAIQDFKVRFKI